MHSEVRNGDSLAFEVMNGPSRDRIHIANMYAFDQNMSIDLEFKVVFAKRENPAGGTTRDFMALKICKSWGWFTLIARDIILIFRELAMRM